MTTRWKVVLTPFASLALPRGAGTSSDGFVYLYGDGPWSGILEKNVLGEDSVISKVECPLDSEPWSIFEGRYAPGA